MKVKFTLLVALQMAIFYQITAQFSVKIVNDNFNSNMMRWEIYQNEVSETSLTNGKYILKCKKEGTAITSSIEVPHLQFSNYRITVSLSKLKGIDDNGFGLIWGGKDENNELEFVISGNGQFKVTKWENGNKTDVVGWTYSTAINKWDFTSNTLKIENSEGVIKYYINDTYVAVTKELHQFGNRVGFVLNETMEVESDYIIVENLNNVISKQYESYENLHIDNVGFQGNKSSNELYYNETAYITIDLVNDNNYSVKDIAIKIENDEIIKGLEFDPLTMIEELGPNERKSIAIKLIANDEIPNQNSTFTIGIYNPDNKMLESKNINIKTVGLSVYYNNNSNKQNDDVVNNSNSNNNNKTYKYHSDTNSCAKGCSGAGLLGLIIGLVIAIL